MSVFLPSHSSRPIRPLIGSQAGLKGRIASGKSGYSTESRFWNSYRETQARIRDDWPGPQEGSLSYYRRFGAVLELD